MATVKTSNGPQKSSTSMLSKDRMAMQRVLIMGIRHEPCDTVPLDDTRANSCAFKLLF